MKRLQCTCRTEPLHHPLPFSQRQVRVFGSIVKPLVRSMLDRRCDLAPRSTIEAKLVCDDDDAFGYASLLRHQPDQKTLGSLGVPAYLDDCKSACGFGADQHDKSLKDLNHVGS